jgi:hypothetical protein
MLQNAMVYNAKGSAIYRMSANLKQFVLSLMKPYFPSMEEAEESSTSSASSSAKPTPASRRKSRKRDEDEDSS